MQDDYPNTMTNLDRAANSTLHMLKTALTLRCQHSLDLHVLFINLVKAFNIVNHDMMWLILGKFGIPNNTIKGIKKLYADC